MRYFWLLRFWIDVVDNGTDTSSVATAGKTFATTGKTFATASVSLSPAKKLTTNSSITHSTKAPIHTNASASLPLSDVSKTSGTALIDTATTTIAGPTPFQSASAAVKGWLVDLRSIVFLVTWSVLAAFFGIGL